MDIEVLPCNCEGLCGSFEDADMNTLPFALESDLEQRIEEAVEGLLKGREAGAPAAA